MPECGAPARRSAQPSTADHSPLRAACPTNPAEEPEPEAEEEAESASSAGVSRQGSTADFAGLEEEVAG